MILCKESVGISD